MTQHEMNWTCKTCEERNTATFDIQDNEEIETTTYYGYCDECQTEQFQVGGLERFSFSMPIPIPFTR